MLVTTILFLVMASADGRELVSNVVMADVIFTPGFVENAYYYDNNCLQPSSRKYIATGKCFDFTTYYAMFGYIQKDGKISVYSASSSKSDCSDLTGLYLNWPVNVSTSCTNKEKYGFVFTYAPLTYGYTIGSYANAQTCAQNDPSNAMSIELHDSYWAVTENPDGSKNYYQSICRTFPGGFKVGANHLNVKTVPDIQMSIGREYFTSNFTLAKDVCRVSNYGNNYNCVEAPGSPPPDPEVASLFTDVLYPQGYNRTSLYLSPNCSGSPVRIVYQPIGMCVQSGDASTIEKWGLVSKSVNAYDIYVAGLQGGCGSDMKYIYRRYKDVETGKCLLGSSDTPAMYYKAELVTEAPTVGGLTIASYHSKEVCQQTGLPDWTSVIKTDVCITFNNGAMSGVQTCSTAGNGDVTQVTNVYSTGDCTGPVNLPMSSTKVYSAMCGYDSADTDAYVVAKCVPLVPTASPSKFPTSIPIIKPPTNIPSKLPTKVPIKPPTSIPSKLLVEYPKGYNKTAMYLTSDCSGSPARIVYQPMGMCVESGDASTIEIWGSVAKSVNVYDIYIAGLQGGCGSPVKYIYRRYEAAETGKCLLWSSDTPAIYYKAEFVTEAPTIGTATGGLTIASYHSKAVCEQTGLPDWTSVIKTDVCLKLNNGAMSGVQTCSTAGNGDVTLVTNVYSTGDCTGPVNLPISSTKVYSAKCGYDSADTDAYVVAKCVPLVPTASPIKPPTKAPSKLPTKIPSKPPTKAPSKLPTKIPIKPPTKAPSKLPTKIPIKPPTKAPSKLPTKTPIKPPVKVSNTLSKTHRVLPSNVPSKLPVKAHNVQPTKLPSKLPVKAHHVQPTKLPSKLPVKAHKKQPTKHNHKPAAAPKKA